MKKLTLCIVTAGLMAAAIAPKPAFAAEKAGATKMTAKVMPAKAAPKAKAKAAAPKMAGTAKTSDNDEVAPKMARHKAKKHHKHHKHHKAHKAMMPAKK